MEKIEASQCRGFRSNNINLIPHRMNFEELKKNETDPFHKLYYEILGRFHVSDVALSIAEMSPELREIIERCKIKMEWSGWVAVTEALPKPLQTVWLTNGKGFVCLGCLIEYEGLHWAESNGVIYSENGQIVSECEIQDLDVRYWHELPNCDVF